MNAQEAKPPIPYWVALGLHRTRSRAVQSVWFFAIVGIVVTSLELLATIGVLTPSGWHLDRLAFPTVFLAAWLWSWRSLRWMDRMHRWAEWL